jgi:glycosyltransferase involved in cell wall biosynthesis
LQEVVSDGVTGRLFDHRNVQEITKMLENLSGPELQLLGQNGRARYLEHFTASVMSDRVTALYEDICSPTRHSISGIAQQASAADMPSTQ